MKCTARVAFDQCTIDKARLADALEEALDLLTATGQARGVSSDTAVTIPRLRALLAEVDR
jgi:hypothetical protein